jgi:hypothetical protein
MRRAFCAVAFLVLGPVGSLSAESLFVSRATPIPGVKFGSNQSYAFIAPYFTQVKTHLVVSIAKATGATGGSNPKSPSIEYAQIFPNNDAATKALHKYITQYFVTCDLTSIISVGSKISIGGARPDDPYTNTTLEVSNVDLNSVTVFTVFKKDPPDQYEGGGSISNVTCPADTTVNLTFSLLPVPELPSRRYLYLHRNPFFDDSVNITVDNNGLLAGSQSSSTQQITAIIAELAQTAASAIFSAPAGILDTKGLPKPAKPAKPSNRELCNRAIMNFVKTAPYYEDVTLSQEIQLDLGGIDWQIYLDPSSDNPSGTTLSPPTGTDFPVLHIKFSPLFPPEPLSHHKKVAPPPKVYSGFTVFFPVPAKAEVRCVMPNADRGVLISQPTIVSLYTDRHVVDPQRDFLTNPQDTFTFNGGIITAHKFSGQSAAKTVVDTITAPIRALLPSVSVTQQVQVQTGGGKPDQTTTTTSTQTGAPKSQ